MISESDHQKFKEYIAAGAEVRILKSGIVIRPMGAAGPVSAGAERVRRMRARRAEEAQRNASQTGNVTDVTQCNGCNADTENSLPPSPSPSLPPSPPSPYPSLPAHPHAPTHTHPPTRGEAELPLVLETEEPPPPATPTPFDHFWKAYPKKLAKGAARKTWDRQKLNPKAEEIIAAVEAQKRTTDWTREGGRFIPHPATWLNDHRWEDDTAALNRKEESAPPFSRNTGTTNETGWKNREFCEEDCPF